MQLSGCSLHVPSCKERNESQDWLTNHRQSFETEFTPVKDNQGKILVDFLHFVRPFLKMFVVCAFPDFFDASDTDWNKKNGKILYSEPFLSDILLSYICDILMSQKVHCLIIQQSLPTMTDVKFKELFWNSLDSSDEPFVMILTCIREWLLSRYCRCGKVQCCSMGERGERWRRSNFCSQTIQ